MSQRSLFHNFFEGKTVLVTGHTGFKGTWLCLWLVRLGARVIGYSLPPLGRPNLFEQSNLSVKIKSIQGDIGNLEKLKQLMTEEQPDIIFHLAAQSLVRRSYLHPVDTFATNVLGTANILETVRISGTKVRVCQIVTSDKCYENQGLGRSYTETDPMGGHDPYSASKGAAELVVSAYRRSYFAPSRMADYGVSVSSVRAGNVVGGGDWNEDRIVPDCIRALSSGRPIEVRNPGAVRPWQYVLDVLSGYLWLAENQASGLPLYADAWNFGPAGEAWKVTDLVERLIRIWGHGSWVAAPKAKGTALPGQVEPENLHEAEYLRLNSSKVNSLLNWKSVWTIEETLEQTVRWYRKATERDFDAYTVCGDRLEEYIRAAEERKHSWTLQQKVLH